MIDSIILCEKKSCKEKAIFLKGILNKIHIPVNLFLENKESPKNHQTILKRTFSNLKIGN